MASVSSSWSGGEDLAKCLRITCLDNKESAVGFDPETVELEDCVQLVGDNEDNPCRMSISAKIGSSQCVARFVLVSEAKRAEVFRGGMDGGEYLTTINGRLMESVSDEEMKMYLVEGDVGGDVDACTLRLAGITTSCWIMALRVGLVQKTKNGSGDRFNLKQLEDMELSDRAKDFKKLFESMQQRPAATIAAPPPNLASALLSNPALSAFGNASSQSPIAALTSALNQANVSQEKITSESKSAAVTEDQVRRMISEAEARLSKQIEDARKEQAEKLDKMLALLVAKAK